MNDDNGLEDYEDSLMVKVALSALAAFVIVLFVCFVVFKVIMAFRGMLS